MKCAPYPTTDELVARLRASKAAARAERLARLADPTTPPSQRRIDEARERYETQQQDANERYERQQRQAQQREVEQRYDAHQREAQRREALERQAQQPKPKPKPKPKRKSGGGRKPSIEPDLITKGIKVLRSHGLTTIKDARKKLRSEGINGSDSALYRLIISRAYDVSE